MAVFACFRTLSSSPLNSPRFSAHFSVRRTPWDEFEVISMIFQQPRHHYQLAVTGVQRKFELRLNWPEHRERPSLFRLAPARTRPARTCEAACRHAECCCEHLPMPSVALRVLLKKSVRMLCHFNVCTCICEGMCVHLLLSFEGIKRKQT